MVLINAGNKPPKKGAMKAGKNADEFDDEYINPIAAHERDIPDKCLYCDKSINEELNLYQ